MTAANANSFTEENYLKAIYQVGRKEPGGVSTTALANHLSTKASSVTDMMKKLAAKELINYQKYQGVSLTETGRKAAVNVLRKHRLWEVFLVEELKFKWDQVHEIAEQLEHIQSDELVQRLDTYLGHPTHDPHGDPIPDREGNVTYHFDLSVADLQPGDTGVIIGVRDSSKGFLQFLEEKGLMLGAELNVLSCESYDQSIHVKLGGKKEHTLSQQVSRNLYIRKSVKE